MTERGRMRGVIRLQCNPLARFAACRESSLPESLSLQNQGSLDVDPASPRLSESRESASV